MEREAMARQACITMEGEGKRLTVRGHRGILEYTDRTLRLRLTGAALLIEGEGLTLERMDAEELAVEGSIDSVQLIK